eukprot:11118314-Alexandrium_andersonii.AAC.1
MVLMLKLVSNMGDEQGTCHQGVFNITCLNNTAWQELGNGTDREQWCVTKPQNYCTNRGPNNENIESTKFCPQNPCAQKIGMPRTKRMAKI